MYFQRFNADYELTARQGADTMAYIALLEEKLRPALVKLSPFSLFPDRCVSGSSVHLLDDGLLFFFSFYLTVAYFLGGCRKLR